MYNQWGREGRRARREQAKALAKEIMNSPHSTEEGVSKSDWALFCLAAVLGFVIFVIERTPLNVGGALIAMCALLVHPVINLPWIRHTTTAKQRHIRQGTALSVAF